ncbi:MaoC family dehydratase [Cupriavidus sp. AcVe19-1a]|uniref:MaoC family dehydratase n=1 Tax=Cupriavidus sp. AcVe19-1a TaxID=2821359 RepID=UPI001AE4057A|nr:MaoC family dehydratase [Cupriavidus sp. AcVe19-1a]MBP0630491.1 MaoC family dehydratase [Cupriavidus sp. AcVe19-1a]
MDHKVSTSTLRTSSLAVTAQAIRTYAELTNDFNPLHVDAEFAAKTPMGRQIAHGTMSLCLIWQSLQRTFGAQALADIELDVRFVKPVHIGDTVTAGGKASADQPRQWDVWVRGDDGVDRIVGVCRLGDERNSVEGDGNGCC